MTVTEPKTEKKRRRLRSKTPQSQKSRFFLSTHFLLQIRYLSLSLSPTHTHTHTTTVTMEAHAWFCVTSIFTMSPPSPFLLFLLHVFKLPHFTITLITWRLRGWALNLRPFIVKATPGNHCFYLFNSFFSF